jgi:16S rRNA (cytidine1402-2'-O)-methyltransferase
MGTLYLVATPIGNLEDISLRALRILKEAALIAAEDTRHTHKLLDRYEIKAQLISYHEHNKISRLDEVLAALANGDVALVSDAGTPGLNDPGYELVRAALEADYPVSPIPGPSAPVAALVASGLPTDAFLFLGYLPRRGPERKKLLEGVARQTCTLIFLETPHRLVEALEDLYSVLGDRPFTAARELTKIHEEFLRGTLSSVLAHYQAEEPRGEYTLVVGGAPAEQLEWNEERLNAELKAGLQAGETSKDLVERLTSASGWRKKEIYRRLLDLKDKA